ncbi:MAG: nucleotidyltransferase family protein [Candidatus Omnitrophota bacterium]
MFQKEILIREEETVKSALKRLDEVATKVLLVVDSDDRFLGAITDGDIRRHILKGKSLNDSVSKIYNKHAISMKKDDFSMELAKEWLITNKVELIPVLDDQNRVVNFTTWTEAFSGQGEQFNSKKIDLPVIIMAGGKGTRLDPFTKVLPKPLIPIGDKTIIEIIMEKFSRYGVKDFYISVNHKAKMIKSYFEEMNSKYTVFYIEEDKPLGTAGSLRFMASKIKDSVIVSNCDIIIDCNYCEIVEFHQMNNYDITIVGSFRNFVIPYGICEIGSNGLLTNLKEKPEYDFIVNTGMYILNKDVLKLIPKNEKIDITDLVTKVRSNHGKVGVFPISEKSWTDIGQWEEYRKVVDKLHFIR